MVDKKINNISYNHKKRYNIILFQINIIFYINLRVY